MNDLNTMNNLTTTTTTLNVLGSTAVSATTNDATVLKMTPAAASNAVLAAVTLEASNVTDLPSLSKAPVPSSIETTVPEYAE